MNTVYIITVSDVPNEDACANIHKFAFDNQADWQEVRAQAKERGFHMIRQSEINLTSLSDALAALDATDAA